MTDTGPATSVEDIIVRGQRRPIGSTNPYPSLPPLVIDNRPEAIREDGEPRLVEPCRIPPARLSWNRDAAAAEALRQMRSAALTLHNALDFAAREYGAVLCRQGQTVTAGPIRWGDSILDENGVPTNPGQQPSVQLDFSACTYGQVVGIIHSHPGPGAFLPSDDDFELVRWVAEQAGILPDTIRLYVTDSLGTDLVMYRYGDREATATGQDNGQSVNPEAQSCGQ